MRVGLYEYLAEPVHRFNRGDAQGTEAKERDSNGVAREFDAGPLHGSTVITKVDGETYDDDPGVDAVAVPMFDGTRATFTPSETYDDDPDLGSLADPILESTLFTRVDRETYDDDPGSASLGFP